MGAGRSGFAVGPLTAAHWEGVRAVYLEGIATRQATFETSAPPWERWDKSHLAHSRLVALDGGTVKGWAALSPVSDRCVYGGVAEVSVYVGAAHRGRGVGRALLEALVESSERAPAPLAGRRNQGLAGIRPTETFTEERRRGRRGRFSPSVVSGPCRKRETPPRAGGVSPFGKPCGPVYLTTTVPMTGPVGMSCASSIVTSRPKSLSAVSDLISASLRPPVFTIWPSLTYLLSGETAHST